MYAKITKIKPNQCGFYLRCGQKPTKSRFNHAHATNKKIIEKSIKNREQYRIRKGSLVGVQWAVRWVGENLRWEGFMEQVCFESGVEESGRDG